MKKLLLKNILLAFFLNITFVSGVFAKDSCKLTMLSDGIYEYSEGVKGIEPDAIAELKVTSENSAMISVLKSRSFSSFKKDRVYVVKLFDNKMNSDCILELYNEDGLQIVALDNTMSDNFNIEKFSSFGHVVGNSRFLIRTLGFSTKSPETGGGTGVITAMFTKAN